jgi:predicted esterase
MIKQKYIKTTKTSRYFILGASNKLIKNVLFVFHGYGQLAKEFVKHFELIADDQSLIVAPEAMNKFYVRGFTGKIGTTWMTKEDRETEINDYVNMIDNVYKEISEITDLTKVRINVLGFSQGGHTAVRWLSEKQPPVNSLILWGSGMPRDTNCILNLTYWNSIKINLVVGNKDRFIREEKLNEELTFINEQKINCKLIKYNGSHLIDLENLQTIFDQINEI